MTRFLWWSRIPFGMWVIIHSFLWSGSISQSYLTFPHNPTLCLYLHAFFCVSLAEILQKWHWDLLSASHRRHTLMTHAFTGSPGHVGVSQVFSSLREHFLTLWYQIRSSGIILYFSCPVLESPVSPSNHGSFQWRIVLETNIRVLGGRGSWEVIVSTSSQHTELGNTCVYPYICIYQIYVHGMHVYVYIPPWVRTHSNVTLQCKSYSFSLSVFVNALADNKKPGSHCPLSI